MMMNNNHTFAICAYKESNYLEDCIKSLLNQTIKTNIIISTSTPNEHIKKLAEKYNIKLHINTGKSGIGEDWNFAVSCVDTKYVTIAHQDDIYEPKYVEEILNNITDDTVIAFTDYGELRSGEKINKSKLLKIKRIMLFPLKIFKSSKFIRKLSLAFGNSICCPSVTLNIEKVGKPPFKIGLKSNLDWDTWFEYTKIKGEFIYISKILMYHRIHEESTTSSTIENNIRQEEDYIMYRKFWPKWVANILIRHYTKSINSNKL